ITGLPPTGVTYDPFKATNNIEFTIRDKTYSKYIAENQQDSEEVAKKFVPRANNLG
ncbi:hypothetical protein A2U01_0081279, partial [Trifolium medium]|nr:hypothetical protein [Trifolium medium]